MTSKQKHTIIAIVVLIACSVLITPMFFQSQDEFSPWLWLSSRIPRSPVVVEPPKPTLEPLLAVHKTSELSAKAWVVTIPLDLPGQQQQEWVRTLQEQGFPAFMSPKSQSHILIGPEVTSDDADAILVRLPTTLRAKAKVTTFDPGF